MEVLFTENTWNPWHGCSKFSEGCKNCYVYRTDSKYEKDSTQVTKNKSFYMPVETYKNGEYKVKAHGDGILYTCFTSDFFLDKADCWRGECWEMMKKRPDLEFLFITKRIERFYDCIPEDWGEGYDNVHICCTCENQRVADIRLPIFKAVPIKKKSIIISPMLEKMNISKYLDNTILQVTVGGESGINTRLCRYEWVLDIMNQCKEAKVNFHFQQTGARFEKDGKIYNIPRKIQHSQAGKAGINLKFY